MKKPAALETRRARGVRLFRKHRVKTEIFGELLAN